MIPSTTPRSGPAKVAIVILNFNKRDDTLACIDSVLLSNYPSYEIVAVDNGSADGSADAIAARFPHIHLIRNATNLGAPSGRNVGWRFADENLSFDYVLFLDNDTILHPDFIAELVRALDADPKAGIICGKAYTAYPSRTVLSIGLIANMYTGVVRDIGTGEPDDGQYEVKRYVDACAAFGFLARREAIRTIDGFDSRYDPYGFEDVDLCLRVAELGYRTVYEPRALIWHKGYKFGRGRLPAYERSKMKNYVLLLKRHTNLLQKLTCAVAVPVRALMLIAQLVWSGQIRVIFAQLRGFFEGIRSKSKHQRAP